MFTRARFATAAAIALLVGIGAGTARADGPRMKLERVDVSGYPLIKSYITYVESDGRIVTGKTGDNFKLLFDSTDQGPAASVKTIDQIGEPIYLVIVAQNSNAMQEAFEDIKGGIKSLAKAAGDLQDSKVALITYAQQVNRVLEFGPAAAVDGAVAKLALDTDSTEVHLIDAMQTALDMLNAKGVPDEARKLIVVVSDGIDAAGVDKKRFVDMGKKALLSGSTSDRSAPIVIDTIGYNPFDPSKLRNLVEMSKQTNGTDRLCKSQQEISSQFVNVTDEIKKQYIVLSNSAVLGQSKKHIIQYQDDNGGRNVLSTTIEMLCQDHGPPPDTAKKSRWWLWLLIGLGGLLVVGILLVVLRRGDSAGAAIPGAGLETGPQMQPGMEGMGLGGMSGAMAAAQSMQNQQGGAMRTMALDLNAIQGKGPTIGWLVAMNGKHSDQTFKLKPSRTIIGTAADSDVVIDDSFMSSKHCEVRYDGSTYKIVDLGSTNGVVLNDKKVFEHDLVDGDTVRLGRTEFKFKSIN